MQLEIKPNLLWLLQSDFLQPNMKESDKKDSSPYLIIQIMFVNLKKEWNAFEVWWRIFIW